MADLPLVTVTGVPLFSDPFAQDLPPSFVGGGLSLNEAAAAQEALYPGAAPEPEEAFAPPVPPLPPALLPPQLLPEVIVTTRSILGGMLTGLGALLFSSPTAPAALDEAPSPPNNPPPPINPTLAEPDLPPNWADLAQGGDERLLDPLRPPGLPVPLPDDIWPDTVLPEVIVEPPPVTTRSPVLPGSAFDFWLTPIGNPNEFPGPDPFLAPDPGPGPTPAPDGAPRIDPVPGGPAPDPYTEPGTRTAPDPVRAPTPDVPGAPLPDIIGNPFGDPIATPGVPDPTRPGTRTPAGPTDPVFFVDPVTPTAPGPLDEPFLTEFQPEPLRPNADVCQCDKKPKKKEKKRRPREKCYRGTYIQRAKGTIFRPTEEVACDAPIEKQKRVSKRETDPFGRPVPRKRGKRSTPTWQDTINDVFYPKP